MSSLVLMLAALANAVVTTACSFGLNPPGVVPSAWLKPYQSDGAARRRLNLAVAMSCSRPNMLQIVGVEYPSFNANSAAF
jgi:hypothetical protein